MANTFKVGDVVQQLSGGPKMTVFQVNPESKTPIACCWFNKNDDVCTAGFVAETLKPYLQARTP